MINTSLFFSFWGIWVRNDRIQTSIWTADVWILGTRLFWLILLKRFARRHRQRCLPLIWTRSGWIRLYRWVVGKERIPVGGEALFRPIGWITWRMTALSSWFSKRMKGKTTGTTMERWENRLTCRLKLRRGPLHEVNDREAVPRPVGSFQASL